MTAAQICRLYPNPATNRFSLIYPANEKLERSPKALQVLVLIGLVFLPVLFADRSGAVVTLTLPLAEE